MNLAIMGVIVRFHDRGSLNNPQTLHCGDRHIACGIVKINRGLNLSHFLVQVREGIHPRLNKPCSNASPVNLTMYSSAAMKNVF